MANTSSIETKAADQGINYQRLADRNFPRKIGRVQGTFELVVHPNYIVIFEQDASTVTVLNVTHARRQWPR